MKSVSPSSNWVALKKQLPSKKRKFDASWPRTSKKPRREDITDSERPSCSSVSHFSASAEASTSRSVSFGSQGKDILQQMVLGQLEYSKAQKELGKYLGLDCEMVGVGIDGSESSLARVSLVNYHGAVILDEYVRQKERVVDYRTKWSGIRPKDLVNAQPFAVVQKRVAISIKDNILVGHALSNDLKALLLSHPGPMTRDTQYYAHKFKVCKSNRVALRDLVKQELGLIIQSGEHSSVTDARAAMAVYRLHQKEWERGIPHHVNVQKWLVPQRARLRVRKTQRRNEGETKTNESTWWTRLPAIGSQQTLD